MGRTVHARAGGEQGRRRRRLERRAKNVRLVEFSARGGGDPRASPERGLGLGARLRGRRRVAQPQHVCADPRLVPGGRALGRRALGRRALGRGDAAFVRSAPLAPEPGTRRQPSPPRVRRLRLEARVEAGVGGRQERGAHAAQHVFVRPGRRGEPDAAERGAARLRRPGEHRREARAGDGGFARAGQDAHGEASVAVPALLPRRAHAGIQRGDVPPAHDVQEGGRAVFRSARREVRGAAQVLRAPRSRT